MVKNSKVYSYSELVELVQGAKDGQVKIAHNTVAHQISDTQIGIRLYYTDVVVVNSDNTYELHTKGFTTRTTQDRLNSFSPARVIQKDFSFYLLKDPSVESTAKCRVKSNATIQNNSILEDRRDTSIRAVKSNLVEFEEGITVDRFGNVTELTLRT